MSITAKELKDFEKTLQKTLDSLNQPLTALALISVANEFYAPDDRASLISKYQAFQNEDSRLRDTMHQAQKELDSDGCSSYEDRVKKFGKDGAAKRSEHFYKCYEELRENLATMGAFEKQHPLIKRLFDHARSLGKGPYD